MTSVPPYRMELWTSFRETLREYQLTQDGGKITFYISGGKDYMLVAKLFQ